MMMLMGYDIVQILRYASPAQKCESNYNLPLFWSFGCTRIMHKVIE